MDMLAFIKEQHRLNWNELLDIFTRIHAKFIKELDNAG